MLAGGKGKTNNYNVIFWWPTEGDRRDFAMHGRVGTWLSQNGKVLDKKGAPECCRLVAEEFPELASVEVADHQNRMARFTR